ncbi:MAG: alpha/beta hydrolase, partial [Oscillospiraceae bacterium]|nr:alpha/beta hydrolase [Oscillospiraceae bacterium]
AMRCGTCARSTRSRRTTSPSSFLHGADDTFILPQNSADMAAATRGAHELYLFEGAGHALSALTDPERYAALLRAFTDQYGAG